MFPNYGTATFLLCFAFLDLPQATRATQQHANENQNIPLTERMWMCRERKGEAAASVEASDLLVVAHRRNRRNVDVSPVDMIAIVGVGVAAFLVGCLCWTCHLLRRKHFEKLQLQQRTARAKTPAAKIMFGCPVVYATSISGQVQPSSVNTLDPSPNPAQRYRNYEELNNRHAAYQAMGQPEPPTYEEAITISRNGAQLSASDPCTKTMENIQTLHPSK